MKKLIISFACIILSFSSMAQKPFVVNGIAYYTSVDDRGNIFFTVIGLPDMHYPYNCTTLEIPESVQSPDNGINQHVTRIENLCGPNIYGYYFDYFYEKITHLIIPSTIQEIYSKVFTYMYYLKNLVSIDVSQDNHAYASLDGVLFFKNIPILLAYPAGKSGSYIIPSSVQFIGSNAFSGCSGLTSITIPSSVMGMDIEAFSDCNGLTSINEYSSIPPALKSSVFSGVNQSTCVLYVPFGCKAAYQAADQWKDFVNIIEMTTRLNEISGLELKISPNPTSNVLIISSPESIQRIEVYSVSGKLILSTLINSELFELNTNQLANGTYLIKGFTDKGIVKSRFIKE